MVSPLTLTARQQQLLACIAEFIRDHGIPPTRADLAQALRLRNRQGIDQHLRALAQKGYLALEPGIARGLRLLAPSLPPAAGRLPLYGRVAAGTPTFADSNIEDELPCDRTLFRPQADFLLRVHGLSMRDAGIADRDILAVHRTPQASNGQIVVARLGDEATVKYYYRRGVHVVLNPANPDFQPIRIDLQREHCHIEGRVVGLLRIGLPRSPC